jgi:hypothetical protein
MVDPDRGERDERFDIIFSSNFRCGGATVKAAGPPCRREFRPSLFISSDLNLREKKIFVFLKNIIRKKERKLWSSCFYTLD